MISICIEPSQIQNEFVVVQHKYLWQWNSFIRVYGNFPIIMFMSPLVSLITPGL